MRPNYPRRFNKWSLIDTGELRQHDTQIFVKQHCADPFQPCQIGCTRTSTSSMPAFVSCEGRTEPSAHRLLALKCKAYPKADEQRPTYAVQPSPDCGLQEKPAHLIHRSGYPYEPHDALDIMDGRQQEGLLQHRVCRADELWQKGQVEHRRLRIQHIAEHAFEKAALRGGSVWGEPVRVACGIGCPTHGTGQRSCAQPHQVTHASELHEVKGHGGMHQDD